MYRQRYLLCYSANTYAYQRAVNYIQKALYNGSNILQEPTRKALELFIEKARKLESFRFVKFAQENKLQLHISIVMDGSTPKID